MTSRHRPRCMRVLAVAVAASVSIEMSWADQLVNCNNATTWMDNASGESPCTVAYFLMLQCTVKMDFAILPLNSSSRSYYNPLGGQWCTCNTVVYNLMSACAVCQDGFPTDFITWTNGCSNVTYDYPDPALAESFKTPQWAYVNVTSLGSFNLEAAEEVAGVKKGWSTVQIALPIVIGVVVALLAGVLFYFYRRRLKRRYTQIADAYPSPPAHMYNHSQSYSQQNIPPSRPAHHHAASSSSLGLHSLAGRGSPSASAPSRKKSVTSVAWERARMHAPRKLGGLLADRPTVHERTRGADWSIDVDPGDVLQDYDDPWHSKSSSGSGSGLHSKEASGEGKGEGKGQKEAHASRTSLASKIPRPAGHGRSESQVGLLANTSPDRIHPIRDSPDLNNERTAPGIARGIISGLSGIGLGLGLGRRPPVAVVSSPPRRGFNLDDVDSARSPTVPADVRDRDRGQGRESESFVFVEREASPGPGPGAGAVPTGVRTSLNLAAIGGSAISQSQGGSSGSRTRSDGSGETGASGSGSGSSDERGRARDSVMLISRSPGQDFNSMASPVATEETSGLGLFNTSVESENWPAALTDTSSVLLPSFARAEKSGPLPPAPPPTAQTYPNSNSNSNSPSHSAPGTPRPQPSRILTTPENTSTQLLVPAAVRAAGGYVSRPESSAPLASTVSLTSTAVLPNARLFGSVADSLAPEPPSAVSNASAATANVGSEHSSSDAYSVPNPFTFDERRGGSVGAANALRLASPAPRERSRTRADIIE